MMNQWWMFFFFLIKYSSVNSNDNQCNYIVNKSDNSSSLCSVNECYKFVDLFSLMVEPKTCKTSLLVLSFSSYKTFILFRDQLQWKIGDLFSSRSINKDRQLILFVNKLDSDDKPFDHDQLSQLGINIDLYILYIKYIENKNYLKESIHYNPNYPEWNMIKIKIQCLKLSAFDKYPCSNQIISPSLFHRQRPTSIFQSTTQMNNLSNHLLPSSSSSKEEESFTKSNEEKKMSPNLILIIMIPLITMLVFIVVYIILSKYSFKKDLMTKSQPASIPTISDHSISIQRISSSSSISANTIIPENRLNVEHVQKPAIYRDYHLRTKNLNNNYEKVTLDNISVIGQQRFVPISFSNHY